VITPGKSKPFITAPSDAIIFDGDLSQWWVDKRWRNGKWGVKMAYLR